MDRNTFVEVRSARRLYWCHKVHAAEAAAKAAPAAAPVAAASVPDRHARV